jgi:hypothetical protein
LERIRVNNNDSDSNYNQPSGGGGGGSILYNLFGLIDDVDASGFFGLPGLNGGSVHLTNNNSSVCYNGSLGSNESKYYKTYKDDGTYEDNYEGRNGIDSTRNNKFSGGGGGSYGGYVEHFYNKNGSYIPSSSKITVNKGNLGGYGGVGYRGGGGGGGGATTTDGITTSRGGNGGKGGVGFVTLYFY